MSAGSDGNGGGRGRVKKPRPLFVASVSYPQPLWTGLLPRAGRWLKSPFSTFACSLMSFLLW